MNLELIYSGKFNFTVNSELVDTIISWHKTFWCIQGGAKLLKCLGLHLVFLITPLTLGQSLKAELEFHRDLKLYVLNTNMFCHNIKWSIWCNSINLYFQLIYLNTINYIKMATHINLYFSPCDSVDISGMNTHEIRKVNAS